MPWGDAGFGGEGHGTGHGEGPRKEGGFGSGGFSVQNQPFKPKKKGGHHGVFGIVENLGSDVGHALVGIGPGLVKTVQHPIGAAKAIGKTYQETYGPLTHGDVGKFLHNLYEHPLGPILDVATIATLGAGAGAKAGILSADAGKLTLRSPAVLAGQEGKTITKLTSHNPAIRARQKLIHNAMNRLPQDLPLLGETARYGKQLDRLPRHEALRAKQALRAYNKSVRHLSNEEFAALHLIERGVHPHDYAKFLKGQPHVEPEMLKVLGNQKIADLVDNPSKAIQRAMPAYEDLARTDAELKIGRNLMTQETADASAARLYNEVYGKTPTPQGLEVFRGYGKYGEGIRRITGERYDQGIFGSTDKILAQAYGPNLERIVLKTDAKILHPTVSEVERSSAREIADRARQQGYDAVVFPDQTYTGTVILNEKAIALRGGAHESFPTTEAVGRIGETGAGTQVGNQAFGGRSIEIQPRPHLSPRAYVPDVLPGNRVANADFAKMGGGVGVAKLPGSLKYNKGTLARTGRLALHPDILGPEYLRTIKYGLFDDIHSELMASAVRIPKGMPAPEGWVYLRKKIVSRTGNPRPQKIHKLTQEQGAIESSLQELVGSEGEKLTRDSFSALVHSDREIVHGDYLVVPKRLVDRMSGEFHRSNTAVRLFLDKPTKVWRALVLGFRVGFLTNNVVGNHLLYALQAAGPDGMRAYLNAIKREKGIGVVRSLLDDKKLPPALRQQFMDEFFPEHVQGTFGATQSPVLEKVLPSKTARRAKRAGFGIVPATQALAEGQLRRGLVETMIRKSPEFRKVYRAIPRQTRDFELAAKRLLKGEGGAEYQRMISDKVNNALGDYLGLSSFEQNTLRAVVPFYAWYKAISTITIHLAADTPGRANALSKIGQLGSEDTLKKLGTTKDYLQGLIPIGGPKGGKQKVLSTAGLNPFQTDQQLIDGLAGVLAGKPGDLGKAFSQLGPNPFLLGAVEALAGKNLFTGKDKKGGLPGVPGSIVSQVGEQLPQTQLIKASLGHGRPSKLYGKQSAREAVLQFLGAPVKQIDVRQAQR